MAESPLIQDRGQIGSISSSRGESRATPPETQDIARSRHRVLYPSVFCKIDEPLNDTRKSKHNEKVPLVGRNWLVEETTKLLRLTKTEQSSSEIIISPQPKRLRYSLYSLY